MGLNLSIRYLFGIRGPGDVMFCASDIGWVVGHSYILYAPLLAGAATVLFEGKPVGTPDAGTFWRILAEHRVNVMFTAPTALRAIRREDPENTHFERAAQNGALKQLRALFLAGERSEPSIVIAYQKLLEKLCAPGAQVIDVSEVCMLLFPIIADFNAELVVVRIWVANIRSSFAAGCGERLQL